MTEYEEWREALANKPGDEYSTDELAWNHQQLKIDELKKFLAIQLDNYIESYTDLEVKFLALQDKYNAILYQVEQVLPDETRHETAIRMIRRGQQFTEIPVSTEINE